MNINKNPLRVMFFTPHTDDFEFGSPFMYIEALRLGNRIIEVVMTNKEFGTKCDEFKRHRFRARFYLLFNLCWYANI